MKRILITGANSYIGTSVEKHLAQWPEEYHVDTIDMVDGTWREKSFAGYDSVFHVAGIAHSDTKKVSDEVKTMYYRVNTDLAIETAEKAKANGVMQFIFMSSAIVYGDSAPIGQRKVITRDTIPIPANFYGDSKLKAEEGIQSLGDEHFAVVILRPPMIYGSGSKGNYPVLARYARILPMFPDINNERSMLYIGNLAVFVRLLLDSGDAGIFFPQNVEFVRTSDMVKSIADEHGHRIWLTRLFNPLLRLLGKRMTVVNKVFGNLTYDKSLNIPHLDSHFSSFRQSIAETEGRHA